MPLGERLRAAYRRGIADDLRDEAEGRARADAVPARGPDRVIVAASAEASLELGAHAGLADPWGPDEHHGAGDRLGDALLEEGEQRAELPVPSHARRGLPQERAVAPRVPLGRHGPASPLR